MLRWAARAILAADAATASVAVAGVSESPACNDSGSVIATAAAPPLASGGWLTALAATPGAAAEILADADTRADAAVVVAALSHARAQDSGVCHGNVGDVSADADRGESVGDSVGTGGVDEDDIVRACDVIAGLACCGLRVRARSGDSGGRARKRCRREYECNGNNSHDRQTQEGKVDDVDEDDDEDEDGWALFPAIAQLNHACVRAAAEWHVDGDRATLRARRRLCAGEEVTVSYLGAGRHRDGAGGARRTRQGRGSLGRDHDCDISGSSVHDGHRPKTSLCDNNNKGRLDEDDGGCNGDDKDDDSSGEDASGASEDECNQRFCRSRRAWLYESFGFVCDCSACASSGLLTVP